MRCMSRAVNLSVIAFTAQVQIKIGKVIKHFAKVILLVIKIGVFKFFKMHFYIFCKQNSLKRSRKYSNLLRIAVTKKHEKF